MSSGKKKVVLLGATGSIGDSTLDVISQNPDLFELYAVCAHTNINKLKQICNRFQPEFTVVTCPKTYKENHDLNSKHVLCGIDEISRICASTEVDMVVAGIVGSAGMIPVLETVKAGNTLLLANKEALIVAGELVMKEALKSKAKIIPLDSEHNAIYQCLSDKYEVGETPEFLDKITLTASGGPFWNKPKESFSAISPQQACAHPNWDMGAKISVDSATLMNKGLEVIEAHWLFNLPSDQIDVVIHPQSIIHSMVHYFDGSVIAQLGEPDMRIPIAYGLGVDKRIESGAKKLNLVEYGSLDFIKPDVVKFPCLNLAREVIEEGGTSMAVLNYANEISVAKFLANELKFTDIPKINAAILSKLPVNSVDSIEQLLQLEHEVGMLVNQEFGKRA